MPQTLRIHLLGDFQVIYGDQLLLNFSSPRLQELLAYLLLHRDAPQSRRYIAFSLWPDSTEKQAHTNLRYLLHSLRQTLPEPDYFLSADSLTLQWCPDTPFTLDVADFETGVMEATTSTSLKKAIDLYRGELLPDCYDDWIQPNRERLREMSIEALERLIWLLEQEKDYLSAIRSAERLLHQDPLREGTYRHLMRLHALSGDRLGVVRTYQTCANVLKRELDIEVSPATQDAYQQFIQMKIPSTTFAGVPFKPRSTNLPIPLTSFIGREGQVDELRQLLLQRSDKGAATRLLTLTGPGGCGKTRLAIEVASGLVGTFKDGVWLIELASLSDPRLLPQAVARIFNLHEQQERLLIETLTGYLETKQILLVLDNCEHLLDACAQLIMSLLQVCPQMHILATSRERIHIPGETVWQVPPLTIPDRHDQESFDGWKRSAAVRLFVDRATSILPTFELNRQNAGSIVEICRRLDGIPLAIELAAARINVITINEIAERLQDRFALLTGGSRMALPKHQTLGATMDWSYALLPENEQALLRGLSVFAGGWTLEAAEAIHASDRQALDLLHRLVDKSLIISKAHEGSTRFWMLETIRQYAHEKLVETGEEVEMQNRHLRYFLAFSEKADAERSGPNQIAWLNRLEIDHDNLRSALSWALQNSQTTGEGNPYQDIGLRLLKALWNFWYVHNHWSEGRRWMEAALLQEGGDTTLRAWVLLAYGCLAQFQTDYEPATAALEKSLRIFQKSGEKHGIAQTLFWQSMILSDQANPELAIETIQKSITLDREAGNKEGVAYSLHLLGEIYNDSGEHIQAIRLFEESLVIFREMGDQWGIALSLVTLAKAAYYQQDYLRAEKLSQECLGVWRQLDDKRMIGIALTVLGGTYLRMKRYDQARSCYLQTIDLFYRAGDRFGLCDVLEGLAELAIHRDQYQRATLFYGAADTIHEVIQAPVLLVDQPWYQSSITALREEMGEEDFQKSWAEGKAMDLEQAIEYALATED